ncbi:hypothetical protein [Alkalihalobacillus sp. BA299]|uniref:hypothetical protein n=1 Tax=Alkalihalobacillus sp. BA299 TaxID=2815938 RepID=UPI001FFE19C5|nr:hypothetical protein [Alkalihalobacillus sp. BA299]
MTDESYNYYNDSRSMHDDCHKYKYYHVTLTTTDGNYFDGIIEDVGTDNVTVLVGEDVMEGEGDIGGYDRQYDYGGYGFPRRRFRRFRRRRFPLASLVALALLPYIVPQPYPYPYPYPYYYPYY